MDKFEIWKNNATRALESYKAQFKKLVPQLNDPKTEKTAKEYFKNQLMHIKKWLTSAKDAISSGKLEDKVVGVIQLTDDMKKAVKSFYDNLYRLYQPYATASLVPQLIRLADQLDREGLISEAGMVDEILMDLRERTMSL
jgi:hypothetical protein